MPRSPWGASPPAAPIPRGGPPVPLGPCPNPSGMRACGPGLRPSAFSGPLFAHSASRTRPQRCACVLGPLRRGAPAALGPLVASGRGFFVRPLCALALLRAPRALSVRRAACSPSAPLRAPLRSPLLLSGSPCRFRRSPLPSAPPAVARFARCGFGGLPRGYAPTGGRSGPGPLARCRGLWSAPRPRALAAAPACAGLPIRFLRLLWASWGSPLRPPAPPPPLGAPGGPVPPAWAVLLAALFPARPAARAPPPRRVLRAVDKPEIVNRGLHGMCDRRNLPLTFPENRAIFEVRCPCRSHLRAAREGIHGRRSRLA